MIFDGHSALFAAPFRKSELRNQPSRSCLRPHLEIKLSYCWAVAPEVPQNLRPPRPQVGARKIHPFAVLYT